MLLVAVAALQMTQPFLRLSNAGIWQLESEGRVVLEFPYDQLDQAPTIGEQDRPATPVYLGYPHGPKDAQFVPPERFARTFQIVISPKSGATLQTRILTDADSFACSSDPTMPLGSTFGRPDNANFDSIYERSQDWLISFDKESSLARRRDSFNIQSLNRTVITFRPNYYRDHLGYFLWDRKKPLWTKPIAGWCSWMAYLQDVTEAEVEKAATFFAANLKDYGYKVIQIDDGYQRTLQNKDAPALAEPFADTWTKPNAKFPSGLASLAHDIKAKGMTPGIWVGYYAPLGLQHKEGYVTDPDGKPHKGPWVGYAMNGHNQAARDEAYIDTIRELKRQGWDYFKIDTLRHILYDNYRQAPDYWKSRNESMEDAYRAILAESKKAAGSSYVMACWGTLPELAGLPDGARIGEDVGPDVDSMRRSAKYIAQFQYLNNVVWRNDPDYMCLRVPVEQARAWASLTFLAGGHVMASDPIEAYDEARVDILRRVGPPLFTRPNTVVSHSPDPEFFTLDCEKDGEQWHVIGRFAWEALPAVAVPEGKFGLSFGAYLGFDFWMEQGFEIADTIPFHALAPGECQVICVRQSLDRPQVLGTNRHLSQGAYELSDVKWTERTLSGTMQRGKGREWSLYLHVPAGFTVGETQPKDTRIERNGNVLKMTFPESSRPVSWLVRFALRNALMP